MPHRIPLRGRDRYIVFDHDGEQFRVAFYGNERQPDGSWSHVRRTGRSTDLAWAIAAAMGGFTPDATARSASEYAAAMGWTPAADPDELLPNAPHDTAAA